MKNEKLYVLIACEESQTECEAFRRRGFEAFSADLQMPSSYHADWHILGDVTPLLQKNCTFMTMGGGEYLIPQWDLIIAHPPCTYLTNAGEGLFSLRNARPEYVVQRWKDRAEAAVLFMKFVAAQCDHVAVENPKGYMNTHYRKPDQVIHPYMFAKDENDEEYELKRTCLWLKGLPKLIQTNTLQMPNNKERRGVWGNGKVKSWTESGARSAKERSKSFQGIADAMAEQWGEYIENRAVERFA